MQFTVRNSGVYYFSTEDPRDVRSKCFICVVVVSDLPPERLILLGDEKCKPLLSFMPSNGSFQIRWSDQSPFACKLMHCAYEADVSALDLRFPEASVSQFRPTRDGFHWPETSITGLLRHSATSVGLVNFSDYNHLDQFANYLGTVLVTPKINDIYVIVDDKGFTPEVSTQARALFPYCG